MLLELKGVNTFYGTSHVLQDVSLGVDEGEVVALLGRNGAGKTTTLRSIIGLTPPASGSLSFAGAQVRGRLASDISRMGIAYMPDDLRIFPDLTCAENLLIAAKLSRSSGYWNQARVEELFPVLGERREQKGLNMSGGEKKMLALGRALMANPAMILLDEPSEGLAPMVVAALSQALDTIGQHGITLLMADQNLKFCRRVWSRGYIMEKGRIVHQGGMEEIWADQEVVQKYLAV